MAILGYEQVSLTTSAVEQLEVPEGTNHAYIQATGANVRFTLDGQDPTTSYGMILVDGAAPLLLRDLVNLKAIAASGTPKLNVHYHG